MDFEDLRIHEMNISKESIDYMLDVIKKYKIKKVLEVGCFNGYSALNFSTVAEEVKTIELDRKAIEMAKENFKKYNVKNVVILEGDAKEVLEKLNEEFDFVLIDAMKNEYKDYLIYSFKLVKKGFIYADNTISHKEYLNGFFDYLENSKLKWKELGIGKGLVEIKI